MVYDITFLYNILQKKTDDRRRFSTNCQQAYIEVLRELQSKLVFDCKLKLIIDNTTSYRSPI